MTNKIPFMQLILVTGIIATLVAGVVIYQLYATKLDSQKEELQELVRDQAELFDYLVENGSDEVKEMLAGFASDESILLQNDDPANAILLDPNLAFNVYGETGRFLGAKIIDNKIVYFRVGGSIDSDIPDPTSINADLESPMRSALLGTPMIALSIGEDQSDYMVASYPVVSLEIAIVAGFSMSELQEPYIRYGVTAIMVALGALLISWLIYRQYGASYIDHLARDVVAHKADAKESRDKLVDVKSKQARTEAQLEESEQKYKSIFESSEDPMWLMLEGKFIHCNNAVLKTFNAKSIEDFVDTHPSHFSPLQQPDGTNSFLGAEERIAEAGEKGYARFFWTHKRFDGEEFPAEVTLTRINVGGLTGLHAMVRDITEEKIIEDNLQKALVDAERANVAKSEFLASMSHEFRTPLNAILGFSQMLEAQYLGPLGADKYGEYVGDIHTSGAHLLDLINDILDISAIEAGKNPMEKAYFDIEKLAEECIATVEPSAEEGKITIEQNIASGLPQVFGHRRGIKQIIINIMANAIKYNHEGGKVELDIHMDNDELNIVVNDTGLGIEEEFLPRILEPFSRADENSHMAQEGTGLGLSICQKLIEAYEGSLDIQSTYGVGTTVTIKIPVHTDERMRDTG